MIAANPQPRDTRIPDGDPGAGEFSAELVCLRNLALTFNVVSRAAEEHFARYGLTGPQAGVLKTLSEAGPDGLAMSELSDRLCVSRPNVTGLVERLHGRGLVERVAAVDRRQVRVRPTDDGRRLIGELTPLMGRLADRLLAGFDPAERRTLSDLLSRWRSQVAAQNATEAGAAGHDGDATDKT
jgi:MarR family 2-MHQ and catechol resistance regulon transcriptional repressor